MKVKKFEITDKLSNEPSLTDAERAILRLTRRNTRPSVVHNLGVASLLEILAAIGDKWQEGERTLCRREAGRRKPPAFDGGEL